MLRSLNEIIRFQLQGIDEEIGRCKDFLFDDQLWVVRYMVADTNKWLPGGRKILISPISLNKPNWELQQFPINLTREGIKNSPSLNENQPISHLYESELFKYYGYGNHWMNKALWENYPNSKSLVDANVLKDESQVKAEDRHLRSTNEVKGYEIHATDQKIGHIADFILNDEDWTIPYIVVDTRNWLPGGDKVLIYHQSIKTVNWAEGSITVNVSAQKIKESPPFDLERLADLQYEVHLRKYSEISQDSKYADDLKDRL
ncbi:PRC-barrel domain-containing protein [Colwellia hornerae]|uniref:PRC-barrel domain containing protein n=1 Tax=Colwellia hornerae TaxID=89402 RepID=A0A5C6Q5D7_9GAMM|nr:PRC-barrel domain-containing protein [Colwellia hornerae]TWX51632.1 PRC-barrel domain containing protein [Colwellia hornerae]TWX57110.1 PRC-barrel domain containing protein [Colwellia hornerae]TWX63827.1 PRC-barrel domain containing protein [Colwellia hornerae]